MYGNATYKVLKWRNIMYFSKKIISNLTPMQIFSLLESSEQFIVKIENTKFNVKERKFYSNKVLFPILKGIVNVQKNNTIIDVTFELSKSDKVGLGMFLICIFSLACFFGFVSSDIILAVTLICFGLVLTVVFWMLYVHNCRRVFKRLVYLLKSTT